MVKIMFTDVAIKGFGVSPLIETMQLMAKRTEEAITEIERSFLFSQI